MHPNASLFKAPEIKRAVQQGQAQIGEILLVNFQNEWQIFGADGLPFLADSYDESMKLYKAQKPFLEKKLGEQGMMLLYTVAWPPQGIYTKRTLNSAADMKGLKWRAYSPATARIAELVGAQPVTVQAAELSQAMATGVVDSYMSSGSTGYDSKTYEHIKNWYDTQAWLPKNAVLVNKAAFNALDKADAGRRAQGRRRRRRPAAGSHVEGGEHPHPEPAETERHEHHHAAAAVEGRHEEGGRHDAEGMAGEGRAGGPGAGGRVPQAVIERRYEEGASRSLLAWACGTFHMRRTLDWLYDAAAWLAALAMIGVLVWVLLSIVSRQLGFNVPGIDAYAGYSMAAAGFLALAHTLKRNEHIRVTLLIGRLKGGAGTRAADVGPVGGRAARRHCSRITRCGWRGNRMCINDVSTGNDATPLWIPQLAMALGTVVLLVAFIDEWVLELRGKRVEAVPRGGPAQ